MKRVVVRVDKVLQHIYIGVCVLVCEIPPHFTLQGGIETFGQRTFNVTVLSCEKGDASFFEKALEMFVQELFTFVGLNIHGGPLLYHRLEGFCHVFSLLRLDSFSKGKSGEDIYSHHYVRVPFVIFLEWQHLYQIQLPLFVYTPCLSLMSGKPSLVKFVFGVGIHRLQCVFYVSESVFLKITFPQFRSTGETSRVSHPGETVDGIFF